MHAVRLVLAQYVVLVFDYNLKIAVCTRLLIFKYHLDSSNVVRQEEKIPKAIILASLTKQPQTNQLSKSAPSFKKLIKNCLKLNNHHGRAVFFAFTVNFHISN